MKKVLLSWKSKDLPRIKVFRFYGQGYEYSVRVKGLSDIRERVVGKYGEGKIRIGEKVTEDPTLPPDWEGKVYKVYLDYAMVGFCNFREG